MYGGRSAAFAGIKTLLVRAAESLALLPSAPDDAPSNPLLCSTRQNEQHQELHTARRQGLLQASVCISILDRLSIAAAKGRIPMPALLADWGRHGLLDLLDALAAQYCTLHRSGRPAKPDTCHHICG